MKRLDDEQREQAMATILRWHKSPDWTKASIAALVLDLKDEVEYEFNLAQRSKVEYQRQLFFLHQQMTAPPMSPHSPGADEGSARDAE